MATLYIDASENAKGTNMPFGVLTHPRAVVVTGLEYHTGADFIVSPDSIKSVLHQNVLGTPAMLVRSITSQSFLFQRKTGTDMLNSIPNLASILERMLAASEYAPWLLPVGVFERMANGSTAVAYKGARQESNWKYAALRGAWDSWQDLGGNLHMCEDDVELERFVDRRLDEAKIKKIKAGKEIMRPTTDVGLVQHPQVSVLVGFPHVGGVLADRIMKYCAGNLAQALSYMGAREPVEVEGVGAKLREDWRQYLGLNDDDHLLVVKENEWRNPMTQEELLALAPASAPSRA